MPAEEAPCVELGGAPQSSSGIPSPSPSDISSASSPEPQNIRAPPMFRVMAMPPPEPAQLQGQEELERRLPGYRRIVIPRELTLIELLKQSSGVSNDEEVLQIREARLRVIADKVGLRRLHILVPYLRSLNLDGSIISSLRDLGIGLVHLKILSVNRCGLTSLDGVWGLSALRELHAAGNRLQDLGSLAALQKLHTLNLADNPISDSGRLWMLAVCSSLRRLTLSGTPLSDEPDYRSQVSSALPFLNYLDDLPLHTDNEEIFEDLCGSSSDSEEDVAATAPAPSDSPECGPSTSKQDLEDSLDVSLEELQVKEEVRAQAAGGRVARRARPATTEGVPPRARAALPPRPRTAHDRPHMPQPSRLQIMNTLMDEEWVNGGSRLTSHTAVCGNLAQALRRPASARRTRVHTAQAEFIQSGVEVLERNLAAEIPRAPRLEDWERFKKETGIEIDLDFNKRPDAGDAESAIDRLERIERETAERLANPDKFKENFEVPDLHRTLFEPLDSDFWKLPRCPRGLREASDVDSLFEGIGYIATPEGLATPENSLPD